MHSRLIASILFLGISGASGLATAQDAPPRGADEAPLPSKRSFDERAAHRDDARRAKWEAMTPEERAAKRAERRAKWDALTPEQRAAAKERFHERHPGAHPGDRREAGPHDQGAGDGHHTTDEISPGQAKSNRAHLRHGKGISRPAGVDETTNNQ